MVYGNLLSTRELALLNSSAERTKYLGEKIGISQEELESIWSLPVYQRVFPAAELIYEKTNNIKNVTSANVSAVIMDEYLGKTSLHTGGKIISHAMKDLKENYSSVLIDRQSLSSMQILREQIEPSGIIENIEAASNVWPNFKLSWNDWLRDIKIPEEIDHEVATLLGIEWGDGYINKSCNLFLGGNKNDFPFYENFVKKSVKNVYNIDTNVFSANGFKDFNGKRYKIKSPRMCLGSKAVVSWNVKDLGFPTTMRKVDVKLPTKLGNKDNKEAFMEGIVGTMGTKNRQMKKLIVRDKDKEFIHGIKKLSFELGYRPVYFEKNLEDRIYHVLFFTAFDTKKINMINPRLQ